MASSQTTKRKATVSTSGQMEEHIVAGGNQVSNTALASIKAAKMKNQVSGRTVSGSLTSKMMTSNQSNKVSSITKSFSKAKNQLNRHNCSKTLLLILLQAGMKVLKKSKESLVIQRKLSCETRSNDII